MKVRPLNENDRAILQGMIERDPEHSAKGMTPDFFFSPDTLSLCFEDICSVSQVAAGLLRPIFYVRLDPCPPDTIRIHMQFDEGGGMLLRTARTLAQGFEVVKDRALLVTWCRRLVFESISQGLRELCIRRFGFVPISGTADLELQLPLG